MRIMITGANGPAGQALGAQLSGSGHTVVGVDMNTAAGTGFSLIEPVVAASDPQLIGQLTRLIEKHNIDLLIPTVSDELVLVAAATEAGVFGSVKVAIGPTTGVRQANDKYLTMKALASAGVNVPLFALPSEFSSVEEAFKVLGSPLILKPRVARGGRGVQVLDPGVIVDWSSLGDDLILQEFAPGIEYAPMVHRATNSDEPWVSVVEKTELKQGRVGNAVSTKCVGGQQVADVTATAGAAVVALGLFGPVDLDIRRLSTGIPVVLEINARFGANSRQSPEILHAVLAHAAIRRNAAVQ